MSLVNELAKKGILSKSLALEIEKEVITSGRKEEEILLEKRVLDEKELFSFKANLLKIPLKEISPEELSLEVLELIPEETAKHYQMIPLAKRDNLLEIGMVDPEDLEAKEALKFLARTGNFSFQIFLITPSNFQNLLKQYKALKREMGKVLGEIEAEVKEIPTPRIVELEKLAEEAPVSKMVAVILRYGVEGEASDIHIEPTKKELRVRFRFLGKLHTSMFLPLRIHSAVVARVKILAKLRLDETRIPQDGRFSMKFEDREIDFRVSTFPTAMGEKVAIRILDPRVGMKKCEELGLSEKNLAIIKEAISKPFGLILATGPTGSGKTTTLYALLQILNKEEVNIVTLEDPVEYFIEGINQSQIRPEIGYDFATGLRQILRQDPDIIMVGEIRDPETTELAIHAALTGHIVLSTLHTNDVLGVIPRLIDLKAEPYLIPPTLSLAIAQRLVRRLCDKCKRKVKPSPKIEELILKELEELPKKMKEKILPGKIEIWEAVGCDDCKNMGFSGRIGLFEMLKMTPELSEIILKEPTEKNILKEAKRQGMITMRQDGILKVLEGITTIEEVIRETR
jgi:type IV pilus assembly protein PilB